MFRLKLYNKKKYDSFIMKKKKKNQILHHIELNISKLLCSA